MMKTMRQHSFTTRLKSLAFVFGLAIAFASCANDDLAQNGTTPTDDNELTTFSTGDPATRTTMESNGKFYWEAGDRIWVKDDKGTWQQSSNAPTGKTDNFKFKVPGKFSQKNTYEVYYPGKNGNRDKVSILKNQTQAEPNTTAHFGASGDCGMATATKVSGKHQFAFALNHKAAYLLFLPRTSNTILHDCYLTKVEVNSDNNITNTYTLDPVTGELTGTGSGQQIVLTTKGNSSSTYKDGFPLTNTGASAATNGAYVVIKPGTHKLKIRYWVKDIATSVEGAITKILPSATYDSNKFYNITANLDVKDYDGDHYYAWDAQEQYWHGYEWTHHNPLWQPTLNNQKSNFYPHSKATDPTRWQNDSYPGLHVRNDGVTPLFKKLPNVNEMTWYAKRGNAHWDNDELWTTMGHLYKSGMWFKKKAYISGFSAEHAYDNRDWRTIGDWYLNASSYITEESPSASEINQYFFLPCLGMYNYYGSSNAGMQYWIGNGGLYWSSSAYAGPGERAYALRFSKGSLDVYTDGRYFSYRAQPFTYFGEDN